MKYFKHLGFYLLAIVDAVINFVCSIFGAYPTVDISTNFLILWEMKRINSIRGETEERRAKQDADAATQMQQAKETLDG